MNILEVVKVLWVHTPYLFNLSTLATCPTTDRQQTRENSELSIFINHGIAALNQFILWAG